MATGDMPPGSKGNLFVHDPKVSWFSMFYSACIYGFNGVDKVIWLLERDSCADVSNVSHSL